MDGGRPQGRNSAAVSRAGAPHRVRIKAFIRSRIGSGAWPPGATVPTEAELMERFGVSRMTAHHAVRELTAEGLLERTRGRGTFVSDLHPISSFLNVRPIDEEIRERGHCHETDVLKAVRELASRSIAEWLEIEPGAPVFRVRLVHRENGVPIQLEDRHVVARLLPDFLDADFAKVTPSAVLFARFPLSEAEHTVEAALADARTARALAIKTGEAVLIVKRRTWSRGRLTTAVGLVHPASRYRLFGRFKP